MENLQQGVIELKKKTEEAEMRCRLAENLNEWFVRNFESWRSRGQ